MFTVADLLLLHIYTDVIVDLLINSSVYICVIVDFVLFFSCEQYHIKMSFPLF